MKQIIYTTEVKIYNKETQETVSTDTWDELHIFADEGKVFKRISTGEILTSHIGVGTDDDVNDFEEIDYTI